MNRKLWYDAMLMVVKAEGVTYHYQIDLKTVQIKINITNFTIKYVY